LSIFLVKLMPGFTFGLGKAEKKQNPLGEGGVPRGFLRG
jgi:hypothetical protein